jgi:hypothetical protein
LGAGEVLVARTRSNVYVIWSGAPLAPGVNCTEVRVGVSGAVVVCELSLGESADSRGLQVSPVPGPVSGGVGHFTVVDAWAVPTASGWTITRAIADGLNGPEGFA